MFKKSNIKRDAFMLKGAFAKKGFDRWWHSFTAINEKTGEERAFFIEFFACNPKLGKKGLVLGQLEENQVNEEKPSYLMVNAGAFGKGGCQLHRFYPWENVKVNAKSPFYIKAMPCYFSETETRGNIEVSIKDANAHPEWMGDAGSMQWNIKIKKEISFNPEKDFEKESRSCMLWHAEGMRATYSGAIVFNGVRYRVVPEKSFGFADKNWGNCFPDPWIRLSSCCLKSNITGKEMKKSAFALATGGRISNKNGALCSLSSALIYEGKNYEFINSKYQEDLGVEVFGQETETEIIWHTKQENSTHMLEIEARCPKKDMLHLNYENPLGERSYTRLWNGGNGTAIVRIFRKKNDGRIEMTDSLAATYVQCQYGEGQGFF